MSTKKTTTEAGTFDPTSMSTFQAFQPAFRGGMLDIMQDPLKATYFNTMLQMSQAQNRQAFGQSQNIMNQNLAAGGFVGNMPAFAQMNLLNNQRALSAAQSNTFNNLLLGANQMRFGALSQAGGYRPFQTGGQTTQRTSGLGTWLPQVAGMGLSAFTGGFGGQMFSPFAETGGYGVAAAGLGPMPGSVDTTMMPSSNTLIGPSY